MTEKVNITMDINKKEFLSMLSSYYTEKLGKDVNVKAKQSSVLKGYGMWEYPEVEVTIYFENETKVGPVNVKVTNTLSDQDVMDALNEILDELNYSVQSVNYKTGTRTVGYYMDEHEESYFNGVNLTLKEKGIQRKLV